MQPLSEFPLQDRRAVIAVLADIDDTLTTHGRLHAVAYGPQVAYRGNGWGIAAKWQREDHARNKAEGDKLWLQFFFGL